jgi:hypothetical protein
MGTPKPLRFEQVLCYTIPANSTGFKMENFLPFNMEKFLNSFGISQKIISSKEDLSQTIYQTSLLEETTHNKSLLNSISDALGALLNTDDEFAVNFVTVMGVPIVHLDLIWTKQTTWPGIMLPYITLFSSMLDLYINQFEFSLIPSTSLEVLSISERIIQYLFSGSTKKLGIYALSEGTNLIHWLTKYNFPRLMDTYYSIKLDSLPCINIDNWPLQDEKVILNCFSSFTDLSNVRQKCYSIECTLLTGEEFLPYELFDFLMKSSKDYYAGSLQTLNRDDLLLEMEEKANDYIFTSNQICQVLETNGVIKQQTTMPLDIWVNNVISFFFGFNVEGKKCKNMEIGFCYGLLKQLWPKFCKRGLLTTSIIENVFHERLMALEPRAVWLPWASDKTFDLTKGVTICSLFLGNNCIFNYHIFIFLKKNSNSICWIRSIWFNRRLSWCWYQFGKR